MIQAVCFQTALHRHLDDSLDEVIRYTLDELRFA